MWKFQIWNYFQVINSIVRISHLLVCVNSSANFLIYYVYGTKFRRAFVATYGPIWNVLIRRVSSFKKVQIIVDDELPSTASSPQKIELENFKSKYGPTLVWMVYEIDSLNFVYFSHSFNDFGNLNCFLWKLERPRKTLTFFKKIQKVPTRSQKVL